MRTTDPFSQHLQNRFSSFSVITINFSATYILIAICLENLSVLLVEHKQKSLPDFSGRLFRIYW